MFIDGTMKLSDESIGQRVDGAAYSCCRSREDLRTSRTEAAGTDADATVMDLPR